MKKYTGVCKWFNPKKGFGFLTRDDNSEDIFVHQTAIHARGFRSLSEGEKVEFNIEENNGRTTAFNVSGEGGDFVRGGNNNNNIQRTPRHYMNTENIEKNLKAAEEDLSAWKNKEFSREKVKNRYSQLKTEWDKNEIIRMNPDERLTMELTKSIDYWKNKLENIKKHDEDENKEMVINN